jgi:GTP-binding protein EngB required for normal cell division
MADNRDRIAGIEKAIREKYGEEAIVHPRANWDDDKEREYLEQIKKLAEKTQTIAEKTDKVDNGGFFVSKKLLNKESKRNCPVCSAYSFNVQDDVYMNKYKCCQECFIQYVEGRENRWKTGWRPNNGNNT